MAGKARAKERDDVGDILGLRDLAETGVPCRDLDPDGFREFFVEGCIDVAWCDRKCGDPGAAVLPSDCACQRNDAGFRSSVVSVVGILTAKSCAASDIDDDATVRLFGEG